MAGMPKWSPGVAAAVLWALCGAGAPAAGPHPVTAKLLVDTTAVRPGGTFTVGVLFEIADRWHIYWRNPGDAGLATAVGWTLPEGFRAGPLRWPVPKSFRQPGDIVGYGYEGSVLLTARVTAPDSLKPGSRVAVAAEATWLACKEVCLPGEASLSLRLPVGGTRASSRCAGTSQSSTAGPANAALFAEWSGRLPVDASAEAGPLTAEVIGEGEAGTRRFRILLKWRRGPPAKLEWLPAVPEAATVENVQLRTEGRQTQIGFAVRFPAGRNPPDVLETLVVFTDTTGSRRGVRVPVRLRPPGKPAPDKKTELQRSARGKRSDTRADDAHNATVEQEGRDPPKERSKS